MHNGESAVPSLGVCLCDQASAAALEDTCNKSALQGAAASEGLLPQAAVFESSSDWCAAGMRTSRTIRSSRSVLESSLSRSVNGYFPEFCAATNFNLFPSPCS